MNNNLLNVIKEIVTKNGDTILSEPRRVSAFLADLAKEEPKPQKNVLVKCLEQGFVQLLKNVSESERDNCKQHLAQRLHEEEGLDLGLCGETLELLAAVLFGKEKKEKKNNCGTSVKNREDGSVISSKSAVAPEFSEWRLIRTFEGYKEGVISDVNSVAFSPGGKYIVSGGEDCTLKLWEVGSGRLIRTFEGHESRVYSVAFSPDGKYVVSGSGDKTLKLWEAGSGRLVLFIKHKHSVNSVAFSPDGKYIVSGSDNDWEDEEKNLKLWEAGSGRLVCTYTYKEFVGYVDVDENIDFRLEEQSLKSIFSVAFSPDGKRIISGGEDGTLKLWEAGNLQHILTFKEHEDYVQSVAFNPDGKYIVSGSHDGTLKLWEAESGCLIRTFEGYEGGFVKVGNEKFSKGGVNSVAFSPDGNYIVSGSGNNWSRSYDKNLKLWETASGRLIRTFEGHERGVNSVVFNPDGKYIVSGSCDGTLKLWGL
jgi:WD40 repeat protein